MDDKMDQYSQLSKEFDRVGLADLLDGISVAGDRFYVVEHLFASGDRKSTRLNSSHPNPSRMPSSA